MDILGTIKAVFTVASQWMSRKWGSQTSEQAALESAIVDARDKKRVAFEALRRARTDDDIRAALLDVNRWDAELTRLHREAAAKWP